MRKYFGPVAALALGLLSLAAVTPAEATVIDFALTVDNCTGTCGGGTGPGGSYGTVEVSDLAALPFSGIHVDVSLFPPSEFVNTGAAYSLMFSLSGNPTITIDNLTTGWHRVGDVVGDPSPPFSAGGDFGEFQYAMACDICGSGASNSQPGPFSFDMFASGLDISVFDFIDGVKVTGPKTSPTITPTGIYFVTDIIGQNGKTGRIGSPGGQIVEECTPGVDCVTQVPEPSSLPMMLFGALGLFGFVAMSRRKSRATN